MIETYAYGATRERLINETSSGRTYYVWGGSSVVAEYAEATSGTTPNYNKAYIFAGSRLLMTATKASSTTETQEFQHPDRLGTRLVTNAAAGTYYQQSTFPFGTAVSAETTGNTNQVFITYDRSAGTGLDYANNRTYSKGQSRFTQVDPLQTGATSSANPQSHNLYSYTQNTPTDFIDPTGLFEEGPDDVIRIPYYYTNGHGSNVGSGKDEGQACNPRCLTSTIWASTQRVNEKGRGESRPFGLPRSYVLLTSSYDRRRIGIWRCRRG